MWKEYYKKQSISIHAPPRGATARREGEGTAGYFNSRPSARGDAAMADISAIGKISIHAPPRGATMLLAHLDKLVPISIHAPPRGATRLLGGTHRNRTDFNSRPSARGDFQVFCIPTEEIFQFTPLREGRPKMWKEYYKKQSISIHAPPRGATIGGITALLATQHFNSRPSARGDARWITIKKTRRNFNSRPSARGDI